MLLLAIDTCDARGSVAVLRDTEILANRTHDSTEEYSLWLSGAVAELLQAAKLTVPQMDVFAVTTGPGSFTGARIGLTAVKAWAEVYDKPIAAISRLEILARQAAPGTDYVAGFFDGSRNQIFAALYLREGNDLQRVGDEAVLSPGEFLQWVHEQTAGKAVAWASLDPEKITGTPEWGARAATGETVTKVASNLAPFIGRLGLHYAQNGKLTNALQADANYVRRTDAEVFFKGNKSAVSESK